LSIIIASVRTTISCYQQTSVEFCAVRIHKHVMSVMAEISIFHKTSIICVSEFYHSLLVHTRRANSSLNRKLQC